MIITIDGPSGTGKSTVAKGVAKKLGFTFFDTGAMYRSLGYLVLKEGKDPANEKEVLQILPKFHYEIHPSHEGERRYFLNGEDVSDFIRTQEISQIASQISSYLDVREAMVKIQREFGREVDAVFEGRDMGTVVFPEADLKIFLTADTDVRAERRFRELVHKFPDMSLTKEAILKKIEERDLADTSRKISPLKKADDAILIDTSRLSAAQVISKIVKLKPKRAFPKKKFSYAIVYWMTRLFFKLFFRLKIEGLEHFRLGAAVIAANHASFYDPPVLSISCPEEVHFLARDTLFDVPILGRLIKKLNAHPIARGASDIQVFKTMIDLLSGGKKLILFPEGKRSFEGELLPIERGIGFLVHKARCRIIPAYIEGTFDAWPRRRKFPKLFGRIKVTFGPPIEWEEEKDKRKAQERIVIQIDAALKKLKHECESMRPR